MSKPECKDEDDVLTIARAIVALIGEMPVGGRLNDAGLRFLRKNAGAIRMWASGELRERAKTAQAEEEEDPD